MKTDQTLIEDHPRLDVSKTPHGWAVGSQHGSVHIKDEETAKMVYRVLSIHYRAGLLIGADQVKTPILNALGIGEK